MKVLVAVLFTVLATAGVSYAAGAGRILNVRNGDDIQTKKILCIVRAGTVTCGAKPHVKVTATVSKTGVAIVVNNKARYVCLTDGTCSKP